MTDYTKAAKADVEVPEDMELVTIPAGKPISEVELVYPEFSSLCPLSDRHDMGEVTIRYKPHELILETKAIRDYLASWRNIHNWQEYITGEIAERLQKAGGTEWLSVEIVWAPRGGIFTKTTAERKR